MDEKNPHPDRIPVKFGPGLKFGLGPERGCLAVAAALLLAGTIALIVYLML
jgi:hypothetical protein